MSGQAHAILSFTGGLGLVGSRGSIAGLSALSHLELRTFPLCRFGIARINLAKKKEASTVPINLVTIPLQ